VPARRSAPPCASRRVVLLVSLRINGLDTHRCYRDILDVIEPAGDRVDTVLVPKVSCAGDVHLVATLVSQIDAAHRLPQKIGISVLIETAAGMHNVDEMPPPTPSGWRRWCSTTPTIPPRCRATPRAAPDGVRGHG